MIITNAKYVKQIIILLKILKIVRQNKSGNVKKLETALKQLKEKVTTFIDEERKKAVSEVESEMKQLMSDERFGKLTEQNKEKLQAKPKELILSLMGNPSVQNIHTVTKQFVDVEMVNLWADLERMAQPKPDPLPPTPGPGPEPKPIPKPVYKKVEDLLTAVKNSKPTITDEKELDAYLANVRSVLSSNLSKGIRIIVKAK